MNREEDLKNAAEQYELTVLDKADLHVNYEEDNYDAGARDAIIQFASKAFVDGAEWADAHPKETNGCKYCMGEIKQEYKMVGYSRKGRPKYENVDVRKPIDFGDSCKMTISANLLRMDYDAYSCDSSFLNEILINYCPFCGRRLK